MALVAAGLTNARVVERFDPFRGTSKEAVARKYGVQGVNVLAVLP
ncbi:MAG: hypothetical protein U0166_00960 [Acidobacteriota bacterium]